MTYRKARDARGIGGNAYGEQGRGGSVSHQARTFLTHRGITLFCKVPTHPRVPPGPQGDAGGTSQPGPQRGWEGGNASQPPRGQDCSFGSLMNGTYKGAGPGAMLIPNQRVGWALPESQLSCGAPPVLSLLLGKRPSPEDCGSVISAFTNVTNECHCFIPPLSLRALAVLLCRNSPRKRLLPPLHTRAGFFLHICARKSCKILGEPAPESAQLH